MPDIAGTKGVREMNLTTPDDRRPAIAEKILFDKRMSLLFASDRSYQYSVEAKGKKSYRVAKDWFESAIGSERQLLKTFDTTEAYLKFRHKASELVHGDEIFEHSFPFQQKKILYTVRNGDEENKVRDH